MVSQSIRSKLLSVKRHPLVIGEILEDKIYGWHYKREINYFINKMKSTSNYKHRDGDIRLNKLCCLEDWDSKELCDLMFELKRFCSLGAIHRKEWEWSLGLVAMKRFHKLNQECVALGVGAGREPVLYYLANNVKHVHAVDLYEGSVWNEAPADFTSSPRKYVHVDYKFNALTPMKMDARNLRFRSNEFDVVFSFSSIEHFGGDNHSGALQAVNEIARVLKEDGIAIITTEFVINDKEHKEFFNRRTVYSDLIDKIQNMKLVEDIDFSVSHDTLDCILDYFPHAALWDSLTEHFKLTHPHILLRRKDILFTSIMLVFAK